MFVRLGKFKCFPGENVLANYYMGFFIHSFTLCTARNVFLETVASTRDKVETLSLYMQVYHRLHCAWWKWALPCTMFALSTAAVMCTFIGLRYRDLPLYLYWIFWFAGLGVVVLMIGTGHDIMFAKKLSGEIVEKLQSSSSADLRGLGLEERKKILKRSKAMTGLQFNIAGFINYTWAVPFRTGDEILRQLLFFLSL